MEDSQFDLKNQSKRAIEQMREMNRRSKFCEGGSETNFKESEKNNNIPLNLILQKNLPFEQDTLIILMLILILLSETSDNLLILALIFILF